MTQPTQQPHEGQNVHSSTNHSSHTHAVDSCCSSMHNTQAQDSCQSACGSDHDHVHSTEPAPVVPGAVALYIPAMDCASEEGQIREVLALVDGIERLTFSLGSRTLFLHASDRAVAQARQAIEATLGYQVHVQDNATAQQSGERRARWMAIRMGLALALAIAAELISFVTMHGTSSGNNTWNVIGMVLAGAAILLAGFSTYLKGLQALRQLRLNISALMTVAVTGAFLIGQWPEAAMVMALYSIAELIEARAVDRARNAVKQLLDLAPDTADALQADGAWKTLPIGDIAIGQQIRIRPGARIALDGMIEDGQTSVDQSPVTGESMPVEKQAGDSVFAGTINQSGLVIVRTTALANDSTLARIVREVENAQNKRAPTQQFVDRFAAIYTPLVFLLSLASVAWLALLTDASVFDAIYTGLVLLVIACPCALVIATPVTIVSGLTAAARRGILIKGGVYLESAHKLRAIALDKTGTITEGRPRLLAAEAIATDIPHETVLHWARCISAASDHPVSKAITAGLPETAPAPVVQDFQALVGRGVEARVDGDMLYLGNHRLIEELNVCTPQVEALLQTHERQGRTVTLLANNKAVLAIFAVADAIKPSSHEAIARMHKQGIHVIMLTGDNQITANAIAKQAGLDAAVGDLLPEDKLSRIRDLQQQYGVTGMTGDGINDAPALAQADIGFAMGKAGTDIAVETADIVLMADDLRRIPETIKLSLRTRAILYQNISLALGIKLIFMVLALAGSATMWMAVFADMGASLLVVFNGLRLLSGAWTSQDNPNAKRSATDKAATQTTV